MVFFSWRGMTVSAGTTSVALWGGLAAVRFKDVVDRWNTESMRLYHALHDIAETIRHNEAVLQEAGQTHAHHIAAAGGNL